MGMKFALVVCCAALAAAEPEAKPKADADPYLLYGGYGLGYAGLYGYAGYPYTYGYYGKRSADAEPKADADPYLYGYGLGYRTYGYGYPYAYGAYGYYGRDLLMLSQRLMLIPISCTEDMALAMPDITDMLDTLTPTDTTERDPLMLSQRLMLMLLSSTELTDMVLDTEPTDMDTH